jgi:GNAT superfamily N-acetyltransferase
MRARQVKNPDITYTDECTDAYSGQQNFTACIYVDKEIVGCVEYVLYSGELTVSDIQVKPEYKRMGYGSRLMKYIKEENPRYNYISSMKTEDGTAFVHKDINLYEFQQGKNPYDTMGIGKIPRIKQWFEKNAPDVNFRITEVQRYSGESSYYQVHVDQSLTLKSVSSLPDNLYVNGQLDLSHSNIISLPDNLYVKWDLDLSSTHIKRLPEGLRVGGSLNLWNCKYISTLPKNIRFPKGSLDISSSNIKSLPDNLYVAGNLNMLYTKIPSLPDNLYVGDNLYINRVNDGGSFIGDLYNIKGVKKAFNCKYERIK